MFLFADFSCNLRFLFADFYGTLNGHSIAYGSMESLRCVAQWTLYDVQLNGVFTVYSTMNTLQLTAQ